MRKVPKAIAEAKGAVHHDKKRYVDRQDEPMPMGMVGEPPKAFTAEESACWREIAGKLEEGWLTVTDWLALEVTSRLVAEYREDPRGFPPVKFKSMELMMSKLGLFPTERAKVTLRKEKTAKSRLQAIEDAE